MPARLRQRLLAAVNGDGGWGYYAGKASRLEPTCWAALALATTGEWPPDARAATRAFLRDCRQPFGLLLEPWTPVPNFAWNGLALLALQALGPAADTTDDVELRLTAALLEAKGTPLESNPAVIPQDGSLQAWSWIDGTFSWVEPTSCCLLAIKRSGAGGAAARVRIRDAEAMLRDRACRPGGWNYGNSAVLGQDLRPYVPTTALGLLAMQDRREDEVVARSLAWLEAESAGERSAMALGLAAICLRVFGRSAKPALVALDAQGEQTGFLGNVHLRALALYAMTLDAHDARSLRIS